MAVTLVDQFRTSKICHACLQAHLYHLRLRDPETGRRKAHWHLKAWPLCRNPGSSGPRARGNANSTARPTFAAASWRRLARTAAEALRRGSARLSSDQRHSARSSPTEEQGHAPSRPLALFIGERGGLAPFICPCYRLSLSDSLYAQDSREPLTICASARRAGTGVTERRSRRAAPRFQMNVASWP